jgi:hypothetical protein
MRLSAVQRQRLTQMLQAGMVSAARVSAITGISRQAVHRWFSAPKAERARLAWETKAIMDALVRPELRRQDPMRITSQENPYKRDVLEGLRRGKLDVKQAARKAKVSERSIRKWCEIHHVRIKAERPLRARKPKQTAA